MGGQKIREPLGCNFYSSFLSQERSREKPNLKKTLPSLSQGRVLGRRGQCGYSLKTVVLLSCPLPDTEGELPCCSCQSFYNPMKNYYQIEIKYGEDMSWDTEGRRRSQMFQKVEYRLPAKI